MKEMGLPRSVELPRVLRNTGRVEVVASGTYRDHQGVVPEAAHRQDKRAVVASDFADLDLARAAVEADHGPSAVLEVVPARLVQVVDLLGVDVEAACRHGVQQRFPHVRPGAVDQHDLDAAATTLAASAPRGELEAPRPPAHDHHALQ